MEFQAKKAIYLQIADYICEQILLKKWNAQEKIPSVRELAVSLEVNPNTVVRTYAFLESRGIIKMQRGIGYFVAENGLNEVLSLKKDEFLTIDLPQMFKSMDLLNVPLEQLIQLYNNRRKQNEKQ